MISKSLKTLWAKSNSKGLVTSQARCMGGGPKRPNMPADERDFDLVVVGKCRLMFAENARFINPS